MCVLRHYDFNDFSRTAVEPKSNRSCKHRIRICDRQVAGSTPDSSHCRAATMGKTFSHVSIAFEDTTAWHYRNLTTSI